MKGEKKKKNEVFYHIVWKKIKKKRGIKYYTFYKLENNDEVK